MSFLKKLNQDYLNLHTAKEDAFWREKMDLTGKKDGEFETREVEFQKAITDPEIAPKIQKELEKPDLDPQEKEGLEGWLRFYKANSIPTAEAREQQHKIISLESRLAEHRRKLELGYKDPASGERISASSVKLGLMIRTSSDQAERKAAYEGLKEIEDAVLQRGFLEVVAQRNKLGRMLGYQDYYDYKVSINEGFSKDHLFTILDDLEARTRETCRKSVEKLIADKGPSAKRGYNFVYYTTGDLSREMDAYFPYEEALGRWGRCFAAMGIDYSGASMKLDLLDRQGKYENGFMHGPEPAVEVDGNFHPARIHFTSNAIPGQTGSGHRALETLFHEGGHAAHFSNIFKPAPCFSQEFAPTSVAFAETQSMFCDSIIEDADWMTRYAKDRSGKSIPWELIRKSIRQNHPIRAFQIRSLLTICYAEKAIYELSDHDLTPDNIIKVIREQEKRLQFLEEGARPVLSVPHLLAGESSAYYHGYVLAQLAVQQTRDYFFRTEGRLLDNPNIGKQLKEKYWKPGNARSFSNMVEDLTGEPFSVEAMANHINKPLQEVEKEAERLVREQASLPVFREPVELNASISLVHGDEMISSIGPDESFEKLEEPFKKWLFDHYPNLKSGEQT